MSLTNCFSSSKIILFSWLKNSRLVNFYTAAFLDWKYFHPGLWTSAFRLEKVLNYFHKCSGFWNSWSIIHFSLEIQKIGSSIYVFGVCELPCNGISCVYVVSLAWWGVFPLKISVEFTGISINLNTRIFINC